MAFSKSHTLLLAALITLLVAVLLALAGVSGFGPATSETNTEVTVSTTELGDRAPEPRELVFHVATDSDASRAVGDRVRAGFESRGKEGRTVERLDGDYDEPLVVLAVDRSAFDGLWRRTAHSDVVVYYSTAGLTEPWLRYRAGDGVSADRPGAIVIGEMTHRDRTRGFLSSNAYRSGIYDALAKLVFENYRGALDGPTPG